MKKSAGILLYRKSDSGTEFFLVHPGGPFFAKKDEGVWSIPKGEYEENEDAFSAAKREFEEESGIELSGEFIKLEPVKLKSGKLVTAWAAQGDLDPSTIRSNTFTLEWPPKSGQIRDFPEVDRAGWFNFEDACRKINPSQISLLIQLESK